jgi:Fe-S-cluster containining protein
MRPNDSIETQSGKSNVDLKINDDILCRIELLRSLQESFVCRRCGECCKRHEAIAFTENDILQVSQQKNISPQDFREQFGLIPVHNPGNLDYYHLPIEKGAACPFYSDRACSIYDARPKVCRGFPFLTSENIENAFKMRDVIALGDKCQAAIVHLEKVVKDLSNLTVIRSPP